MAEETNLDGNISHVCNYNYDDLFRNEDDLNRRIILNDDIDRYAVDSITYKILRYNREDKGKSAKKREPIIIYINTPGGNVAEGLSVVDAICTSETPVHTVNIGTCYSMGFFVFISGHTRFAFPHSSFLIHDGTICAFDSTAKTKDMLKFITEDIAKELKALVIGRTKITESVFDARYRTEWYFLADEAKKLGVADRIIGKNCRISEIL